MLGQFTPNTVRVEGDIAYLALTNRGKQIIAEVVIDLADLEKVQSIGYRWSPVRSQAMNSYYAVATLGSKPQRGLQMHRHILDAPASWHVDHINHNTLDNRRCNLRLTTRSQNLQNRLGPNRQSKSGVRNVYWSNQTNKWEVQIRVNNKLIRCGYFTSLEDATEAARKARAEYMTHSVI